MDDGRKHFLFGITVSEIAFILFFVLLLFSFLAIAQLEKENTEEKFERARAEDTLHLIGEALGQSSDVDIDPDEALTILAKGAEAVEMSKRQERELQKLEAENDRLRRQRAEAKRAAEESRTELEAAEKEKALLRQRRGEAEKQVQKSQGELQSTRGQLANLQKRAGVGDPPCWVVGESGEIEYLFRVTLFGDKSVQLVREAPSHRDADYLSLPSVPEITSRRLQMKEFESLAMPIYQVSERSQPKCRHFVRVKFADREACMFLLKIEDFFYKSVYANDATICTN